MKYQILISEYLERADKLLNENDTINMTYCALELRKAIELIVWTQFIDAFHIKLSEAGMFHFDYSHKLQSKSILKMYDLLKKHIREYTDYGSRKIIITHKSASGSAPYKKDGDVCYIQPELPTTDYSYLSDILHYEKEIDPQQYKPNKERLIKIYERIKYFKDNYTYRFLSVNKDKEKIINNIKDSFGLTDKTMRTF